VWPFLCLQAANQSRLSKPFPTDRLLPATVNEVKMLNRRWFPFAVIIVISVIVGGCSSSREDASADGAIVDRSITTSSTTTTIGPRAPKLRMPATARAQVGQLFSDAIVASDPNGDSVTIEIDGRSPQGFSTVVNARGLITSFQWRPIRAGEWRVEVVATDTGGLQTAETLTLIGRHPRSNDLVLVMGDSVAAGFGRDRSDFSGNDECFRSEGEAYGPLVADALIAAGALAADTDVRIVACAGATAHSLRNISVQLTDANGDRVGEPDSQLDTAIALNPTIITLTIGSTDLSLFDVDVLIEPGADNDPNLAIDTFLLMQRLGTFETNLRLALESLIRTTDAHIVVTTWFDPTAEIPIGVDGCRRECMTALMARVTTDLNDVILAVTSEQPPGRLTVVRLDGAADVWEAKNGIGPDALREGLGPLQGFVNKFTGGSSASCSDVGGPAETLVSTLDCAHPNEAGHVAIAEAVTQVLLAR
jgi:lysophospholipase L1-like esterase